MKYLSSFLALFLALTLYPHDGFTHFGMVIPSRTIVASPKTADVEMTLRFWHPFENTGMDLARPAAFSVFSAGTKTDLLGTLSQVKEQGHTTWKTTYKITNPGLYAFVMTPQPYYEKEEDTFIIHHTKVYVSAFGQDAEWENPLGLPAEIVPLENPGTLYMNNIFRGVVMRNGVPEPHAEIEVEWYPGPALRGIPPHAGMVPQVVKADANGVFFYAPPKAGWWGFAALKTASYTLEHEKVQKPVEEGAVIWVHFYPAPAVNPLTPQ